MLYRGGQHENPGGVDTVKILQQQLQKNNNDNNDNNNNRDSLPHMWYRGGQHDGKDEKVLNHLFLKSILLLLSSIASPVDIATLDSQDPFPEK